MPKKRNQPPQRTAEYDEARVLEIAGHPYAIGLEWYKLDAAAGYHKEIRRHIEQYNHGCEYGIVRRIKPLPSQDASNDVEYEQAAGKQQRGIATILASALAGRAGSAGIMVGFSPSPEFDKVHSAAAFIARLEQDVLVAEQISETEYWWFAAKNGTVITDTDNIARSAEDLVAQVNRFTADIDDDTGGEGDYLSRMRVVASHEVAGLLNLQTDHADGLDLLVMDERARASERIARLTGVSYKPILAAVIILTGIGGFLGYGKWVSTQRMQQQIETLGHSAPHGLETQLGNITQNIENGKANQAQILYYAKQQEERWLTQSFNKMNPGDRLHDISRIMENAPAYAAGWQLKNVEYQNASPKIAQLNYQRKDPTATVNGLVSAFKGNAVTFDTQGERAHVAIMLGAVEPRHIKNAVSYIAKQKFSKADFISGMQGQDIRWSLAPKPLGKRKKPIAGIKNKSLANQRQLRMNVYDFKIHAQSPMQFTWAKEFIVTHGNLTINAVLANPDKQSWEIDGELYEK